MIRFTAGWRNGEYLCLVWEVIIPPDIYILIFSCTSVKPPGQVHKEQMEMAAATPRGDKRALSGGSFEPVRPFAHCHEFINITMIE